MDILLSFSCRFLSLFIALSNLSWMYTYTIIKHTCCIWWCSLVVPSLFLYYVLSSVHRKNIYEYFIQNQLMWWNERKQRNRLWSNHRFVWTNDHVKLVTVCCLLRCDSFSKPYVFKGQRFYYVTSLSNLFPKWKCSNAAARKLIWVFIWK